MVGLHGLRVDRPESVAETWEQALVADRPVVVEAVVDPDVPPMPPHVTFEQAKAYLSAILRGDPSAREMIEQGFKAKVKEFLPR
jgi:pyruvate dehydrogenase (quinone)